MTTVDNSIMKNLRVLQDDGDEETPPMWQPILTIIILAIMFAVLITDRVGTDSVMLTALTVFYISGIIDIKEALSGFSNQGLLTVLVLFVVAEGLNKTGALNWYVGKLFGRPTTLAGAQLRVMIPITFLSGFINDTPLVTVVLPIVIQWAKKVNVSPRFVLMPLSFAALLGGVFTIIGTSTNLVVVGLLIDRYPDDPQFQNMNLFGLGQYGTLFFLYEKVCIFFHCAISPPLINFITKNIQTNDNKRIHMTGVPVGFTGLAYIVLMTPLLLARRKHSTVLPDTDAEDVLLGARVTEWSPAAGRTIKRSGLRDTGGIYLVRVKRQATGNVHHAVSPEFIVQVGDILYFTGLIESFGGAYYFCCFHELFFDVDWTNECE
jgi:Citrate transporter/TrkA-C domain